MPILLDHLTDQLTTGGGGRGGQVERIIMMLLQSGETGMKINLWLPLLEPSPRAAAAVGAAQLQVPSTEHGSLYK